MGNRIKVLLPMVVFGAWVIGGAAAQPDQGKKQTTDPPEQAADGRVSLAILEREAKGGGVVERNGVTLKVSAKVLDQGSEKEIELSWTIAYNGPRSPLIIVKPSLELPTGQTMVFFYAAPKGKEYALPYVNVGRLEFDEASVPTSFPQIRRIKKRKDWFLSIPTGMTCSGSFRASLRKVKECFLRQWPGQFDQEEAPKLFVQVWHRPYDRAEDLNLDAWTGELVPPPLAIVGISK